MSLIKREINISDISFAKIEGRNKKVELGEYKIEIGINHKHHLKITANNE